MKTARSRYVDPSASIGYAPRYLQGAVPWDLDGASHEPLLLPEAIYVGPFAAIGAGAVIGNGCVIDAYCRVEPLARLGEDTLVLYRGTVGVKADIGKRCILGGSISEYTIVEDDCRSFGRLIHAHTDSLSPWDYREEEEPSPIVRQRTFIGHGSLVIGGIELGPASYVCAGATITRSVPPKHIAFGVNNIVHFSKWPGKLAENPMFRVGL